MVPTGSDLAAYLAGAAIVEADPIPLASVRPIAPVPPPGKVVGVGLNYRDHAAESGQPIPEEPILLAKFANSVIGRTHHDPGRDKGARLRGPSSGW